MMSRGIIPVYIKQTHEERHFNITPPRTVCEPGRGATINTCLCGCRCTPSPWRRSQVYFRLSSLWGMKEVVVRGCKEGMKKGVHVGAELSW